MRTGIFILLILSILITPVFAEYEVTFVNSADIPVWVNLQGELKRMILSEDAMPWEDQLCCGVFHQLLPAGCI